MTIAVLYGGKSGEHEVSLLSATSVVRHIDCSKHDIVLIGITKLGAWYVQGDAELQRILQNCEAVLSIVQLVECAVSIQPGGGCKSALYFCNPQLGSKEISVDVVLPILHGTYGEDGLLQGLLEMAELPYCGCGVMASALAMDKEKAKQIWINEGLNVVPYLCIKSSQKNELPSIFNKVEKDFGYPVFVKPCCAGSSVGTAKAESKNQLEKAVADAFMWDEKILIEPFIQAREIECSVTGNASECAIKSGKENPLVVLSYVPGEIVPSHEFYDYDAKYTDPNGAKLIIPALLTSEQRANIQSLAKKAYTALDCSGLARVDFFLDKKSGTLYINELNTLPGFTSISMFPKMCEAGGLGYAELIELLIQQGLARFSQRRSLETSR